MSKIFEKMIAKILLEVSVNSEDGRPNITEDSYNHVIAPYLRENVELSEEDILYIKTKLFEKKKPGLIKGEPTDAGTSRFYYVDDDNELHLVTKDYGTDKKKWNAATRKDINTKSATEEKPTNKKNSTNNSKPKDTSKKSIENEKNITLSDSAKKDFEKRTNQFKNYTDKNKEAEKRVREFGSDLENYINNPSKENGLAFIKKYDIDFQKGIDPSQEGLDKMKIYVNSFKDLKGQYYKILKQTKSNVELGKLLQSTGHYGTISKWATKTMAPSKLTDSRKNLSIKSDKNSTTIGNHVIKKTKPYDWKKLSSRLQKEKGMSQEESNKIITKIKIAADRHDFIIDNINTILGSDELEIIDMGDVTKPNEREQVKQKALNMIKDKVLELNGGNSKDVEDVIEKLDAASKASSDKFESAITEAIYTFSNNEKTKITSADVAELFEYTRLLNEGKAVYLPSASNFKLGDILVIPDEQPTLNDLLKADDPLSAFVTIEDVSVKKDEGGASATKDKILLTDFSNKEAKKDLETIVDQFDNLFNVDSPKIKEVKSLIKDLQSKYEDVLAKDPRYKTNMNRKADWLKNNKHRLNNVDAWENYFELGYMMETIYNNNVNYQAFINSKYKVKKNHSELDYTNGIDKLALLKFEPDQINPSTKKPNNTFPSRFVHTHK